MFPFSDWVYLVEHSTASPSRPRRIYDGSWTVDCLSFSRDGLVLAVSGSRADRTSYWQEEYEISLWDVTASAERDRFSIDDPAEKLALSLNGSYLATSDTAGVNLQLYSFAKERSCSALDHDDAPTLLFSPA